MAESPEPARLRHLGPHDTLHRSMGSARCHLSSLSVGPLRRLTRGKSRIWETCTSGSVRGVGSDLHSYRDRCREASFEERTADGVRASPIGRSHKETSSLTRQVSKCVLKMACERPRFLMAAPYYFRFRAIALTLR